MKRLPAMVVGTAALLFGVAFADERGPARRAGGDPVATAPADGQAVEGRVAAYLLSPEAGVAGLVLDGGQAVRLPPHLGAQVATLFKPGDRVRVVRGPRPDAGPQAPSVTSLQTGAVLGDGRAPPAAGDAPPVPTPLTLLKVEGQVALVLRGPRGEAQGVVLDSGAQVDFPPHVARSLPAATALGTRLAVEGFGRTTRFGTAVQATVLTPAGQPAWSVYDAAPARPPR